MGRAAKFANQALRIRLARHGCTNRPFYHIIVSKAYRARDTKPVEQVGTYDPLPNDHNEKLVAVNFEKLHLWINRGALPTRPVAMLLGLSGFFPVHPMTSITAIRLNKYFKAKAEKESSKETIEEAQESAV